MRKPFLLALTASVLLTGPIACKKDSDPAPACTAPAPDKNIVGTWNAEVSGVGGKDTGRVTFNTDGTYQDAGELLLAGEVNGVQLTTRTYTVQNNQLKLKISGSNSTTNAVMEASGTIQTNECNKMVVSLGQGIGQVTFTRP